MQMFKRMTGLCCVAFLCISARNVTTPSEEISIRTIDFKQHGDSVYLTYSVTPVSPLKKWDGYKLLCTIENGDSACVVDSLLLMGKYSYIYAERDGYAGKAMHKWTKNRSTLEITTVFAYREWMREKSMHYALFEGDCCSAGYHLCAEMESSAMLMDSIPVEEPCVMQLQDSIVVPEPQVVKEMNNTGSVFLEFPVGKSQLLPDFKNNRFELAKIHATIEMVLNHKDAQITGIDIVGYASIEGNSRSNLRLSLNRAESVRRFILSSYPEISDLIIHVSEGGEDWDMLKELIYRMPNADVLVPIIDMPASDDAKEARLRGLSNGVIFRSLSDELFPLLRRVDYTVRFTVSEIISKNENADE